MFGLGMGELLVILAVALLVLGPRRLPDLASGLGKAIRQFRRASRDLQDHMEIDETVRRPIEELRAALRDEPSPAAMAPRPASGAVAADPQPPLPQARTAADPTPGEGGT